LSFDYCSTSEEEGYLDISLLTYLTKILCSSSGYTKIANEVLLCLFLTASAKCYNLKVFSDKPELINTEDKHLGQNFSIDNSYNWLSGFTDAEGFFYIVYTGQICAFKFQINLHKDDINVLYFIQKLLGFGEVRSFDNYASFTVTRLKDIAKIIDIFNRYPLQSTKWLNFQDFAKAYKLYTNHPKNPELIKEILTIKNGMNQKRSDYTMPKDKEINITPYWLLGFIEGEGCFSINRQNKFRLDFSLSQSIVDLKLMQSIKTYLENLLGTNGSYDNAIGIFVTEFTNLKHKASVRIETTRVEYLFNIFIPFLDKLTWHTKKQLDFQDWKNIFNLKQQGHQFTPEGLELIEKILSQMNKNRLSTSGKPSVDRTHLLFEVEQLLNRPSNFELKDGKKWIISLNKYYHSSRKNICVFIKSEDGTNIHKFDSLADCAKFLNVDPTTVSKRITKNIHFLLDNKRVYIKKEVK
jgi:hypothetical protein